MRLFIVLLVIVYLAGIGVVLAPTVSGKWNSGTAAEFFAGLVQELPRGAAWPVTIYRNMVETSAPQPAPAPQPAAPGPAPAKP